MNLDEYFDIESTFEKNKKLVEYNKIINKVEYRSLLHFDNKINEIKEYILSIKKEKKSSAIRKRENSNLSIEDIDLTNSDENKKRKNSKSKGTDKVSTSSNENNSEIGLSSEEKVYKKLVEKYGKDNVHWISNRISDSYGYDIRYKNEKREIKYVEVKTYSNKGRFFISPNEVKFAKDYKDSYELYLVDETIIYRVKNFHRLIPTTEVLYIQDNMKQRI